MSKDDIWVSFKKHTQKGLVACVSHVGNMQPFPNKTHKISLRGLWWSFLQVLFFCYDIKVYCFNVLLILLRLYLIFFYKDGCHSVESLLMHLVCWMAVNIRDINLTLSLSRQVFVHGYSWQDGSVPQVLLRNNTHCLKIIPTLKCLFDSWTVKFPSKKIYIYIYLFKQNCIDFQQKGNLYMFPSYVSITHR